ncbi:MAG: helix-hairpin-helix domain-containing protein, partial [Gemmatimonadota bacterium]
MENIEIAAALEEMADLLEIKGGENPFRIRAYRNAVLTVQDHATPLRTLVDQEADLTELPAIGGDMAAHITELVRTGRLTRLDELTAEIPRSLVTLTRLPGVGPKRARKLWDELDVTTIDELEAAARAGEVAELAGFGEKTQAKILDAIERHRKRQGRYRLNEADELVAPLLEWLRNSDAVERVEVAGSYRRRKETIGDIDLLVMSADAAAVVEHFLSYGPIRDVIKEGENGASVHLANDLQVDMRVLDEDTFGAALVYFTGSKEHNIELRQRALERGLSVSEYG